MIKSFDMGRSTLLSVFNCKVRFYERLMKNSCTEKITYKKEWEYKKWIVFSIKKRQLTFLDKKILKDGIEKTGWQTSKKRVKRYIMSNDILRYTG